jgi:hypothetical protein
MNALEAAQRIAASLEDDGIPYAIGGALALGVWGVPRATKDVDISVFVDASELPRAIDSFERAGVIVDRDTAAKDVARIGLFKARLGRIIVDGFLSAHPQYADMHRRRVRVAPAAGQPIWFISAEDLCVHKLIYGRPKDVTDLESLIAVRPSLDLEYVRSWLVRMVPAGDRRIAILDDLERRFH